MFICALFQDAFIAAEIALLPKSALLYSTLFLTQWLGILTAKRLEVRLSISALTFLKHPLPFLSSLKEMKILPWIVLALGASLIPTPTAPLPLIISLLGLGPGLALWSQSFSTFDELKASNPLFYLQWNWLIHPKQSISKELPTFSFSSESSLPLSKNFPLLRKTVSFTGEPRNPPLKKEKPHILFLFLESFRAKNIGSLGASIPASPAFDALAKKGALFTNCYATGPLTFYANVVSLSGVQPSRNVSNLYPFIDTPIISIPKILKNHGYVSGWFQSAYVSFKGTLPFCRRHGFDEIAGAETMKTGSFGDSWGVHDETLFAHVAKWLKKQKKPAFVNLFTNTNHHPWNAPDHWKYPRDSKIGEVYNRFKSTFAYTDDCLGKFIEELKKENLLENTILFITGDHGQEMSDSCENYTTHVKLSEENLRVPLLIYGEGLIAPQKIDTPCSHLDLFSTVLDLLKIEDPHHSMGHTLLRKGDHPVYFSLAGSIPRLGCRWGNYKWTGLSNGKEQTLHDLIQDPEEKINLSERFPEKAEELFKRTQEYFADTETLFEWKAFAPAFEEISDEILRPKENLSDKELEKWLKKAQTFSSVDLSCSSKISDRGLEKMIDRIGKELRYLILPKSPRITDRTLHSLAKKCPNLSAFYSQDCPLVTSEGIRAILENCRNLKLLSLNRADEITEITLEVNQLQISSLFLGEELPISGRSFVELLEKCPDLISLQVNIGKMTLEQLQKIPQQKIMELCLFDASQLNEETLHRILRNNRNLRALKMTNCVHLKKIDLSGYPALKQVDLID